MESTEEIYRVSEESKKHGKVIGETMRKVHQAERMVIYGLSLSPIDAEVCIVLSSTFAGEEAPEEIFIIDPNHKKIKSIVKFYFPDAKKITGMSPEKLRLRKIKKP